MRKNETKLALDSKRLEENVWFELQSKPVSHHQHGIKKGCICIAVRQLWFTNSATQIV